MDKKKELEKLIKEIEKKISIRDNYMKSAEETNKEIEELINKVNNIKRSM